MVFGKSKEPEVSKYSEDKTIRAMQVTMDELTNEDLESTKRMVTYCVDAKENAINTLVQLDDQGEQLELFEENLNRVNVNMEVAEKGLSDLNKCCGLCTCPWDKLETDGKNYEEEWQKIEKEASKAGSQPEQKQPQPIQTGLPVGTTGRYIYQITYDSKEEEIEENLEQVNDIVLNLRKMAVDMSHEIDSQSKTIDKIAEKSGLNRERITLANKIANTMNK